jgi:hypothetical protein
MRLSIIILVVIILLFPAVVVYPKFVIPLVFVLLVLSTWKLLAAQITIPLIPESGHNLRLEELPARPSAAERKHDRIAGAAQLLTFAMFSFYISSIRPLQVAHITANGQTISAIVSRVYVESIRGKNERFIEYTYAANGQKYTQEMMMRTEAVNDTLLIRILPRFPEVHYICIKSLRKPPLHRGRAVDYRRICYPYIPPAALSEKITHAPWAISYHEYGPWDMNINPVLVVIFPEGGRLKKVTLYHPDFAENVPSEIAETTITGLNEKLAMALAYKLRSGNFPTEVNPKDKLARRRFYDSSHYNFRIYSRGITRDLFYNNAVHYFDTPDKEQAEAAIALMRTLRDE